MKKFSQNDEEIFILDYFKNQEQGTLLSIGENDGQSLSNAFALIQKGWFATLVEPAPIPFQKLIELHQDNPKVQCLEVAVSNTNGKLKFYSSDSHLKNGDTDLLSTLNKEEIKRWGNTQQFTEIEVESVTFATMLSRSILKTFDFITIDAEGVDLDILKQINLITIGCKMLIIEHNRHDPNNKHNPMEFISYAKSFGMKLKHETYENFIFVR